jgi:hypothetical protein
VIRNVKLIEASRRLSNFFRAVTQNVLSGEGQQPRQQNQGCSTMITRNNERSVSYMMQEQIYDIVVIGSGPLGRELSTFHKKRFFSCTNRV